MKVTNLIITEKGLREAKKRGILHYVSLKAEAKHSILNLLSRYQAPGLARKQIIDKLSWGRLAGFGDELLTRTMHDLKLKGFIALKQEKAMQLSAIYPTKEEAQKHVDKFKEMGWGGTVRKVGEEWGTYYRLYPKREPLVTHTRISKSHTLRITPKRPKLRR